MGRGLMSPPTLRALAAGVTRACSSLSPYAAILMTARCWARNARSPARSSATGGTVPGIAATLLGARRLSVRSNWTLGIVAPNLAILWPGWVGGWGHARRPPRGRPPHLAGAPARDGSRAGRGTRGLGADSSPRPRGGQGGGPRPRVPAARR